MAVQTQITPASLLVIGLGGTISLALENGRATATDNLASIVAQAGHDARVETISLCTKDSADITVEDLIEAARLITSMRATNDAFILTTGTDTLEEVAFGLQCLLGTSAKVIVTGAMRPPYFDDYDGVANLRDAMTACQDVGCGVFATIGGHLFLADHVVKSDATRLNGFSSTSPAHPPLPVSYDMVVSQSAHCEARDLSVVRPVPRVDLISASLGSRWVPSPEHLPDGVVVACPGAHSLPDALLKDLATMQDAGRPVVLASRCASFTPSPQPFYPGYAETLERNGFSIAAYAGLTPQKARLKLIFALMGLAG